MADLVVGFYHIRVEDACTLGLTKESFLGTTEV